MDRDLIASWFQRGQDLETVGRFDEAIATYDSAIGYLRGVPDAGDVGPRHALGLVWMNRGNAYQKIGTPVSIADAVRSYDEAIAVFSTLPVETEPAFRHHLGAAWLNRGHAQVALADAGAVASFETATTVLAQLPLDADPSFPLNLAGAHANLAHATIGTDTARAADAARSALRIVVEKERAHFEFAAMSLRARHVLVAALGTRLSQPGLDVAQRTALVAEATDMVDEALALAREVESLGIAELRPLAQRLFQFGAQLYGSHQPQFLAEYVSEHLGVPAFAADAGFRSVAAAILERTVAALQQTLSAVKQPEQASQLSEIIQSLRDAQALVTQLNEQPSAPKS